MRWLLFGSALFVVSYAGACLVWPGVVHFTQW